MKTFTKAFTTVATVAALALTVPGVAARNYNPGPENLINTANELGIEIVFNGPICNEVDGLVGYFMPAKGELGFCTDKYPHQDVQETFRHEMVHVAQTCKAVDQGATDLVPLNQTLPEQGAIDIAVDLGWPQLAYEADDWHIEAEAWILQHADNDTIDRVVRSWCF